MAARTIDWANIDHDKVIAKVAAEENIEHVLRVMSLLTPDEKWTPVITRLVEERKIETRCFMAWLADVIHPRNYLEVGVRRGFSMAMVASRQPDVEIFGFDMWLEQYAGSGNPGPDFVCAELAKVGYCGNARFVSGNSHQTLPAFFRKSGASWWRRLWARSRVDVVAPDTVDLMLVDGDHSLIGAAQDLYDTLPRLAVGGVLVFDDIAPDPGHVDPEAVKSERGEDPNGWGDLRGVWRHVLQDFPTYRSIEYDCNTPGVAIAVRLS